MIKTSLGSPPEAQFLARGRHDICHMHHMQRMCKINSPRVIFYILKVLFVQFLDALASLDFTLVSEWVGRS